MTTVIYNTSSIQQWKTELPQSQETVRVNRGLASQEYNTIGPLEDELSRVNSDISRVRSDIRRAERDERRYRQDHPQVGILHELRVGLEMGPLRSDLSRLEGRRSDLRGSIRRHRDQAEAYEEAAHQAQRRSEWLQEHIRAGEAFLQELRTNPNQVVAQLSFQVTSKLNAYLERHPANLSPQVRLCFHRLEEKLNFFSNAQDQREGQLNYLKLSAFIYEMQEQVVQEGLDPLFQEVLEELVNQTHLNSDLPDELATHTPFREQLSQPKTQHPELFAVTPEQLDEIEQTAYTALLERLKVTPCPIPDLKSKITLATALLTQQTLLKKSKNQKVDYCFNNALLTQLDQINQDPLNQHAAQKLMNLTLHAAGTPSLTKKVLGVLGVILGALLIAASITLACLTFGGTLPLSAIGAGIGFSLAQSAALMASTYSITAAAGATAVFFSFQATQRQGLSKALTESAEEVLKPKP